MLTAIEIIERYEMGLINPIEFHNELVLLAAKDCSGTFEQQAHFVYSNGMYILVQSGIVHEIEFSAKIKRL
jgi:hypothetical protein